MFFTTWQPTSFRLTYLLISYNWSDYLLTIKVLHSPLLLLLLYVNKQSVYLLHSIFPWVDSTLTARCSPAVWDCLFKVCIIYCSSDARINQHRVSARTEVCIEKCSLAGKQGQSQLIDFGLFSLLTQALPHVSPNYSTLPNVYGQPCPQPRRSSEGKS